MTEHVETKLAQIGNRSEEVTGTVSPPVYLSTAYRHRGIGNLQDLITFERKTQQDSS